MLIYLTYWWLYQNLVLYLRVKLKIYVMRIGIFYCNKHTSYWRNKALRFNPWCRAALPVFGAYLLFHSLSDLEEYKRVVNLPL